MDEKVAYLYDVVAYVLCCMGVSIIIICSFSQKIRRCGLWQVVEMCLKMASSCCVDDGESYGFNEGPTSLDFDFTIDRNSRFLFR
jgi:hypothetical protein